MKNLDDTSFFYNEVIKLFDLNDFKGAIKFIKKNLNIFDNQDDIALAYLNSGFLNNKLRDYVSAISDFSKSIAYESRIPILNGRSKDISLNGRSNSRYRNGDYLGAIEDKRKAKSIYRLENEAPLEFIDFRIDYKHILLGTFLNADLEPKYTTLIKTSKIKKSKYDLIDDYKKVIGEKRKEEVINKLEIISESKYKIGDYRASIKALRRAEKFY